LFFLLFLFEIEEKFMKFQVKALIAALALTASGVASAANNPATGNSSLILSVFDRTNNQEVWFDTGWTYETLNEIGTGHTDTNFDGSNTVLRYETNTTIQNFLSGADRDNTYFAIFAGDTSGSGTVAGGKGLISTYNKSFFDASSADPVNPFNWSKQGLVNQTSIAYNSLTGNTTGGALGYFEFDNMGGFGPNVAVGKIGSALGLYQTVQNATNNTSTFIFNNTHVMLTAGGTLVISPVPEADSYAMLGLGLAVVAAVARRRKSA
jgi:hypothetical protein